VTISVGAKGKYDVGKNAWIPPLDLYVSLMEEIKLRIEFMQSVLTNRIIMPGQIAREFCHLQLRLICEILAIGSLAIHNDTSDVKALEKQWSAHEIMPRLEKLNPNFFPVACVVSRDPDGAFNITDIVPKPLDKETFLRLYGKCGGELHRGHLRKIAASIPVPPVNLDDIGSDTKKIIDLLRQHRIASADFKKHYVCVMENTPGGKCAMITAAGWSPSLPPNFAGPKAIPR
jgi:hypothetical protein